MKKEPIKPDFSRIPIRPPEPAKYRDNVPDNAKNNPLYCALPGPRTPTHSSDPLFRPVLGSRGKS